MMNLLKQSYQEHLKKTKLKLCDSLEQLKSSCPDATFRNIREFLKATITELCNTLDSRRCKKRTLNGKYTSPQALQQTKDPVQLSWTAIGTLTNAYDNLTMRSSTDDSTLTLLVTSKHV